MTEQHHYDRGRGFTLVEVLMATIIGALVIVVAFSTYRSVARNQDTTGYYSETMAYARFAMGQIREDLANVFRITNEEWPGFKGVRSGGVESNSADRLKFYMTVGRGGAGDVYEVEYGISDERELGISYLGRRIGKVTEYTVGNSGGTVERVARNIRGLSFRYFDGQDWVEEWLVRDKLPVMVRVTIWFFDPDGQRNDIYISQEISLEPQLVKPEIEN